MSLKDSADARRAPAGGFQVPTVNYTVPQFFPLKRQEVPSRHEGGCRASKRQNFRRSQARLVNSVIDGLNWYSGRGQDTATSTFPRGELACELRKQAESRIAAVVLGQQPPADTPAPAAAFWELLRGRDLYG